MAITVEGQRKKDNIEKAMRGEGMLEYIIEEMEKLPEMIVERVKETGAGASGKGGTSKKFTTPYSRKWGKKRSDAGLQTSLKDFYFSGGMWDDFKMKEYNVKIPTLTFTYGVSDSKQSAKVSGHSEREGTNILYPNDNELKVLGENIREAVRRYYADLLR